MTTAFQRSAFQANAFQIDGGQASGGGVGGGRIAGGTFSRGKWRELQDEVRRKVDAQRAIEAKKRKRQEELAAAERAAKLAEAKAARDAIVDQARQASAELTYRSLVDAAGQINANIRSAEMNARHAQMAAVAERQARLRREADEDEERAIEMLLDD